MNKKKICWITGGYLLQVDLPILSFLRESFDIQWTVVAPANSNMAKTAKEYASIHSIPLNIYSGRGHRYLPLCLLDYIPMFRNLANQKADIYYCNWTPFPYAWIPLEFYIPKDKIIMAMHHGSLHDGMQLKHLYKYYLRHVCSRKIRFQYFSDTQANGKYSAVDKSRVTVIPLALNDYGKSNKEPSKDYIEFLSFGHIIETKNIGLLIRAAEKLYKMTDKKFKVKIVGQCRLWNELYNNLIEHSEIFDLNIQMVPDEMIPDLFSSAHYLVLPYKAVTQSGPLRIAYGYNTPVIASDLDGFKESMEENVTGYLFKSEDVDSLVSIMNKVLIGGYDDYLEIKKKQSKFIQDNLSVSSVVEKYIRMFNEF